MDELLEEDNMVGNYGLQERYVELSTYTQLETKFNDMERKFNLLASWLQSKFGDDPSFPKDVFSDVEYCGSINDDNETIGEDEPTVGVVTRKRKTAARRPSIPIDFMKNPRCKICRMSFSSFETLELHQTKIHSSLNTLSEGSSASNSLKHVCGFCGRRFKGSYFLTHHLRVQHSRKSKVDIPRTFNRRSTSTTSTNRSHEQKKQFECKICNLYFTKRYLLFEHEREKHSESRPHVCHICQLSYKDKSGLKDHLRIHDESNREWHCHRCGDKSFFRKSDLIKHQRRSKRCQNLEAFPSD